MTEEPTLQSSESTTPRPKRRWLQFNLRTLLVLTLVVGSGLGWVMNERRKNAIIQADIDALESFGCRFFDDNPVSFWSSCFDWLLGRKDLGQEFDVGFSNELFTDAQLAYLKRQTQLRKLDLGRTAITKGVTQLKDLELRRTEITDAGLVHLKGLTQITDLDLDYTRITDAGLVHLKGLTQLTNLDLDYTRITDAGLVHLKGLTNLSVLILDDTEITDAGLEHLKGLTNLSVLRLRNSAITDAGLEHLKGLAQLTHLYIRGTRTTKSGVAELQKALPNCLIHDDAKN
ncbi:MAG: hypothetical protein ABL888_20665 [Pirellulaceae bacterium]